MANPPPPLHPTLGPGWNGAPPVNKAAAAGSVVCAIGLANELYTTHEVLPRENDADRPWIEWSTWNVGVGGVREFAAAFQKNIHLQYWLLDVTGRLWSLPLAPGGPGAMSPWLGPDWNNAPVELQRITASQQGSSGGAALWAITEDSSLIHCFELTTPAGAWSDWQSWPATPENSRFVEITAARQNGGAVQFWALDTDGQLWSRYRLSSDGDWSAWSSPNWDGAPSLIKIAACEQGGTRGQQIWGITDDHRLVSNFQVGIGTGWDGWSTGTWLDAPPIQEIAATLCYYNEAHLWAVTLDQKLIGIEQLAAGGQWAQWDPPA